MNVALVLAALLCLATACIHTFMGRGSIVLPMLAAEFNPVAKRTMHAVWHMVTVTLFGSAAALGYAALPGRLEDAEMMVGFIGLSFVAFGTVFLALAIRLGAGKWFLRLSQWTLLIPIGILALLGLV